MTSQSPIMSWLHGVTDFLPYLQSRARWLVERLKQQQLVLLDGFSCRSSSDVNDVLRTVKRFVRKEVPYILGLEPDTEVLLEMPARGRDSLVLILKAGDRKAVLRAFPFKRRRKAEAHMQASALLSGNGVNVPSILYKSSDSAKHNAIFILEEFISGESRSPQKLTDENVRAVAIQLARMHSILSPRWGNLQAERTEDVFRSLYRRISRDLSILEKTRVISSAERQQTAAWFRSFHGHLNGRPFSLTQKDLHPGNAIFAAKDGQHYFIDPDRLQWKPAAEEVVRAYRRLFRDDEDKIRIFNEAYFSDVAPEVANYTLELVQFYKALHRLIISAKLAKRIRKSADKTAMQRVRDHLSQLHLLTLNSPLGSPGNQRRA